MKPPFLADKDRDGGWKGKHEGNCPLQSAVLGIALTLMLFACSAQQHATVTDGGGNGAPTALLRNTWHGGIVGTPSGAITEATSADISIRGAREAAYALRPVEYRTENNRLYYFAELLGYEENRRCRKVQEKVYEDGQLVRKQVIVFCDRGRYNHPSFRYDRRNDRYELDGE